MFGLAPIGIISSVFLKGLFLLFQISAIWLMLSWISGTIMPEILDIVQHNVTSYLYPIFAGCILILGSFAAFFSKLFALNSIKKLEKHISQLTQGKDILVSDYRNVTKLMLVLIDSLVPFIFIISVLFVWTLKVNELVPLFFICTISLAFLFRTGIRYARGIFKAAVKKIDKYEYFGSDEHKKFHQILMAPSYISLVIFILISIVMIVAAIWLSSSSNLISFGFLPIATAIAILQFKSFVGLIVRIGVYSENANRVSRFLIPISI